MNADRELFVIKAVIRSLLISCPDQRMSKNKLQSEYREREGIPIPFAKFGFTSLTQFFASMPDVIKMYNDEILGVVSTPSVQHVEQLVRVTPPSSRGGQRRRVRFNENKRPVNGFQERNGMQRNYTSSTKSVISSKSVILHVSPSRVESKECIQITEMQEEVNRLPVNPNSPRVEEKGFHSSQPSCVHVESNRGSASAENGVLTWLHMLDFPLNALGLSATIVTIDLSCHFTVKKNCNVRVLYVLNPNRVWLRSIEQDTTVERLNAEMHQYYNNIDYRSYRMEACKAQYGLYCAVSWKSGWYRARIVGPLIGGRLKLHLIDLGVVELVQLEHVRLLANIFRFPPAQAVRASLSYLCAEHGVWTRKASDALANMLASEQHLLAYIIDINRQHNVLDIVLSKANGEIINKVLASQTNAKWNGEHYLSENLEKYRLKKRNPSEKYPPFQCIEDGHYPTIGELRMALSRDFHFEVWYRQQIQGEGYSIIEELSRLTNQKHTEFVNVKKREPRNMSDGNSMDDLVDNL